MYLMCLALFLWIKFCELLMTIPKIANQWKLDIVNHMHWILSYRRMFPQMKVRISGLDASAKYAVMCDVIGCESRRYKYTGGQWVPAGRADPDACVPRLYVHPDSPASGECWMRKQCISFHKLKLTNNLADKNGFVCEGSLSSLHES